MIDVPEGFHLVNKGVGIRGPADEPGASVSDTHITFHGPVKPIAIAGERVSIAINGSRFAIRIAKDAQYRVQVSGQVSSTRVSRALPKGRYVGHQDGDWWIFEPVSE